jgi:hypothetical protein
MALCMREFWWRVVVDSKFCSSWGKWCFNKPSRAGWGYGRILGVVGNF